jgi:calcineurin-like phosphoesterase
VSLAPFSGQTTLTVQFVLEATSEVNRMGWYLDDIEINLFSIYLPLIFNN